MFMLLGSFARQPMLPNHKTSCMGKHIV